MLPFGDANTPSKSKDESGIKFINEEINVVPPSKLCINPAKYYIKIFRLTKISYWFGVVFSLLGLSILMIMSFSDSEISSNKAIISLSCIAIIEIVSLLFVLKSNKFQKKMDQLFNNLQKDKQRNVTKKLIESIDDIILRDLLRIELTLYYSGIKNNPVSINESIQKVITTNLKKS